MLSSIGCNRPSGCTQPHLNRFSFCPPPFALENMKSYFMLMLIFIVFRLSLLTLLCNLCFSLGMFDVFDLWFWECSLVFFFVGELHTIYENWTHPLLVFLRLGTPFSTECGTHGSGGAGVEVILLRTPIIDYVSVEVVLAISRGWYVKLN